MSTSDSPTENAQAQLKDLFEKLDIQTNNTTGEADHHFKTLALRHIFSNQPIIRSLPYVAGNDEDRKECANNLTDSFLGMYSSVLRNPRDILKDRSSPVMDYFELLLQTEAVDEVLAKVLGEGKWAATATGEEAGEMMKERFEEAMEQHAKAGERRVSF